jgi:diaminohydroxyphosphoribosylaminopyrimidine deaminase / 5-amino-6-(5-phosphoribosylamino)uracil reductase
MPIEEVDGRFMSLALALGRRGLGNTWPNPAVGAVIVRHEGGTPLIVGRGWTQAGGRPHAEVDALRRAGDAAHGATMYVTLEPCSHHGKSPPCADAIIAAGIARVVSSLEDPNPEVAGQGHARLRAAGIAVEVGLGAEEARRAHAGHLRRMREHRPQVTLKLALSADRKVGAAGRRPVEITGEAARARVHRIRSMNDAILIGIDTAIADDPQLTCRLPGLEKSSPVRVVLDTYLRLPPGGVLAKSAREAPVWVVTGPEASAEAAQTLRRQGVEVLQAPAQAGRLDLRAVLGLLAERGISRLMVEGGPTVAASFVAADLIDEAALFHSAKVLGPDGIDALEGVPLEMLTSKMTSLGREPVGDDSVEFFARA